MTDIEQLAASFRETGFRWPFRRYQALALAAFERGRASQRRCTYVVLPPGAGKTVVGLEIARRLANRTLVLAPNTAVQAQWIAQWGAFQPATVAAGTDSDELTPITVLTYQAFATLDSEDEGLNERALALWRTSLRRQHGYSHQEAEAAIARLHVAGNRHYAAELAGFRRVARRLTARGGATDELLSLLHQNGQDLVQRLKENGPWTLVLDECHHLLQLWGALVGALITELGEHVFVVGLTATPPAEMGEHEADLYHRLFGFADFEAPTPAVVREGDLAPYQELVYLTEPLEHERSYIATQGRRFQELTGQLMDAEFATISLGAWLRQRVVEREAAVGSRLSWSRFEDARPDLALAALRLLHHFDLELPSEARVGERHRQQPTTDDWIVLIEDFCLGYLKQSAAAQDQAAWQAIREALPTVGYLLTRQGIRSSVSPTDRVLALSAAKSLAAADILTVERQSLRERLRALVVCDYERAGREVLAKLRGVLDPQAGSAALLLRNLVISPVVAELNPILLTGRTVAASRATAVALIAWLEQQEEQLRGTLGADRLFEPAGPESNLEWDDVVIVRSTSSWWRPRHYVPILTQFFAEGRSRCLVGTRGLLGEGWDCRGVNVLIDLTGAGTTIAVHQLRGRSIRIDPMWPEKVANNWSVVCVAPGEPKGAVDYARFVRKHDHYYAPTADGAIESGVSHVDARLSPFGPPTAEQFRQINRSQLEQAGDRSAARSAWAIGTPYSNTETTTLRIRCEREIGLPGQRLWYHAARGEPVRPGAWVATTVAAAAGSAIVSGTLLNSELVALVAGTGVAVGGLRWVGRRVRDEFQHIGPSAALEDFAAAVADALVETELLGAHLGAQAVRVGLEGDGYYRCYLAGATRTESELFATALDELLAPLASPRYLVSRHIADPPQSTLAALRMLLRAPVARRSGPVVVYHAAPTCLATNRERAMAFGRAWNRYVSAGTPMFANDPRAQAVLELQRGEDPFRITTQMRAVWT